MDIEYKTQWENITITNDFMFGKVMRNTAICKRLIEAIIPGLVIDHIDFPEEQKTIDITAEGRGVRLDVYVQDGKGTVYDIEMQTSNTKDLPKRSRYYQGMIDLNLIERGATYDELNRSYVIFICTFDLFGAGRHMYTFEHRCIQDQSISLQDEATMIFLNTAGTMNDVDGDLKDFLDYAAGRSIKGKFVEMVNQEVEKCRANIDWRREFMTLEMRDSLNFKKGREEERISLLKNLMTNGNYSIDTAMKLLGIPESEREEYKKQLL